MKSILPQYLSMKTDAAPFVQQVFCFEGTRLTVITPQMIRIEQGEFTDAATLTVLRRRLETCDCETQEKGDCFTLRTDALEVVVRKGVPLEEGLTIRCLGEPAFIWHYGEKPKENLGGTTSTLDEVDGACEIADGVCSRDGFAVIDDSATAVFDGEGWFAPGAAGTDIYFFGYGHAYTKAVQDYCRLTGCVSRLPAFALGNWWSRYFAYTQEGYLSLMDRFAAEDVPLSVGIVDMDWHLTKGEGRSYHDGWTGYTWNEELFPDYRAFLAALEQRGLKTALNLHPAQGVRAYEKQYEAMAKAMGVDPETKETIPCNWLSPQYLKAYFEILHFPYESDGVNFWWLDWQQGSDFKKIVGEQADAHGLEAITPLWMVNHMHYLASERQGKRGMIFSRFAGYGSQRYPIGFSGDTYITWDSLRFQPYFTATASNIGYGWWSHDIGGHMGGVRDDELTARWIQFGVFSPIFRLHSTSGPFNTREPWSYNPRAERVMKDFMRLRHQLFPYLNTMNARTESTQIPLMLPMYHTHPEVQAAYHVPNQYWFGTEMIAAPITKPMDESGMADVSVFFPEGLWTDLFTGTVYRGGRMLDVCRTLEKMPVFLKAGAIVPMQAHVPGEKKLGNAAQMELFIAPGADGCFALVEDDGETLDYREGRQSETLFELAWQDSKAVLTIGAAQDNAQVLPETRSWAVHFIGFAPACRFAVNGSEACSVYDEKRHMHTVTVCLKAGEGAQIEARCESGLTDCGSDTDARCIDLITRAQIPMNAKTLIKERLDWAAKRLEDGLPVRKAYFGCDSSRTLGLALHEEMMRLRI